MPSFPVTQEEYTLYNNPLDCRPTDKKSFYQAHYFLHIFHYHTRVSLHISYRHFFYFLTLFKWAV